MKENGGKGPPSIPPTDPHLEFCCEGDDHPLVAEGDYTVSFVRAETRKQWKGHKLFLWFQIETPGESQGTRLFLPCNMKSEGKISTRSKYYRNWVVAAGKKPDRHEKKRMTSRVFEGKLLLARVATVIKDQKNLPLPDELKYSKIEGLLKRLTD